LADGHAGKLEHGVGGFAQPGANRRRVPVPAGGSMVPLGAHGILEEYRISGTCDAFHDRLLASGT